ncbi:MAG TPA: hypothetical protein PLC52_04850 [Anaerolineales bacterium]|nr:hypothetical protein [Anaerolineales bacterium]HRQ92178.1 hypothetical protein [Anaerolineales bacterium]
MNAPYIKFRLPILVSSVALLVLAVLAGLARIGWALPSLPSQLPIAHGPLMICGFFGTLIALERAVALGRRWMYFGPVLSAVGGLLLVAGHSLPGGLLITLASLSFSVIGWLIVRQAPANYTTVMALGATSWLVGNLLWVYGLPLSMIVYWWAAFLVLTIAGERLELGRLLRPSRAAQSAFLLATGAVLIGAIVVAFDFALGSRVYNIGLLALSLWFVRYDVVRVTLRSQGLPRYIACALGLGYVWMAFSAILGLLYGPQVAGLIYDAYWHGLFVGFVLSMVFAHGPIILPAILARIAVYHPVLYAPLALLHTSLVMRIIGNLLQDASIRRWGGMLNSIAILLFFISMAISFRHSRQ